MKEFLKSVVEHYKSYLQNNDGTCNGMGLADFLFVFPNRRSSLFFCQYIVDSVNRPIIAPNMTTISELFPMLMDSMKLRVPDRIELLFILFEEYRKVSGSNESFDNFLFWGEMILGDFNDADKYLVDARLLFKNLKELKEIDEEFGSLDEETIRIIRAFWTNFNPEVSTNNKEAFRKTWKILFPLYEAFRKRLLNDRCAYEGMLQRLILENLKAQSESIGYDEEVARLQILLGKKVVFVGLTALSKAELELMQYLQNYQMAEFCWDYADPRLTEKSSHASYFKTSTIDRFPNIIDNKALAQNIVPDDERTIEVIEVPSGVGQTIQAANTLRNWIERGIIDTDENDKSKSTNAFHTAVVLPDEKMLLPMLYSIPQEFEPFNVTMGYGLKSTSLATFVDNLAYLQANLQTDKKKSTFYFKNVLPLLSNNYLINLSDGKAAEISATIVQDNKYRVPVETFKGNRFLEAVFKPCGVGTSCISYVKNILKILAEEAEKELEQETQEAEEDSGDLFAAENAEMREQKIFNEVEREFLYTYIQLVESLEEKIVRFNTTISTATFFVLLHKLSQSATVAFSGEPLSGLQVMGVLETRSVDFDNLIILSMNEGIFPAKPLTNSFVPMNLRHAFGMPTQEHRDAVFAYHFYRLLSRAKNVVMIYDSRSDGMQSGEASRYIKQLQYLYNIKIDKKSVQYNIGTEETSAITIAKDERIMSKLRECLVGGNRRLSASVLKYYITCPLRFYFEYVEGLREEAEIEEGIDEKAFGSVVHKTIELIYNTVVGRKLTSAAIHDFLKDKNYISKTIDQAFASEMKVTEISGYLSLVKKIIQTYVTDVFEHDTTIGDFTYIKSELIEKPDYTVNKGTDKAFDVQFIAIYDRLDKTEDGTLRIVDYKTGNSKDGTHSKLEVPEINSIFSPDSTCSKEAFQVLLYCLLKNESKVAPHLYFIRDFHSDKAKQTNLFYAKEKVPIIDFDKYRDEFRKAFDAFMTEIFNPEIPFNQCEDEKHCKYCSFKEICKRD